jgi:hypothetical protein
VQQAEERRNGGLLLRRGGIYRQGRRSRGGRLPRRPRERHPFFRRREIGLIWLQHPGWGRRHLTRPLLPGVPSPPPESDNGNQSWRSARILALTSLTRPLGGQKF